MQGDAFLMYATETIKVHRAVICQVCLLDWARSAAIWSHSGVWPDPDPGGCEEDAGWRGEAFLAWEASTREDGSSTQAAVQLCLGSATQAALLAGKSSKPSGLLLRR